MRGFAFARVQKEKKISLIVSWFSKRTKVFGQN
jgi:hypothetical protein